MVRIEALTPELVQKYRNEIAKFYYDNLQEYSCLEHYTYDEAYEKIADFIYHLANSSAIGYGAFDSDGICGYIWVYPHQFREEKRMYVNEIRVKEEYRNRGIGSQLMKLAEERAKELGLGAIYLHAEAENKKVRKLYEAFGYVEERIQMRKEIIKE